MQWFFFFVFLLWDDFFYYCCDFVDMHEDMKKQRGDEQIQGDPTNINAHNFTFRELATATKNFRQECLLGEGGFGRVYKGVIPTTGQVIKLSLIYLCSCFFYLLMFCLKS
jgi:hypothetical protein